MGLIQFCAITVTTFIGIFNFGGILSDVNNNVQLGALKHVRDNSHQSVTVLSLVVDETISSFLASSMGFPFKSTRRL